MRHKVGGKKLNRHSKHRHSLIKNQLQQLIQNESLTTTETKAKMIKSALEKMISKAKKTSLNTRRVLNARLFDSQASQKLNTDLVSRFAKFQGGYMTMIRLKKRRGDNTLLIKLELKKAAEKIAKKSLKDKTTV